MQFLNSAYIGDFLFRYIHILVGITWIGLLYYFNLVQVPALAAYGDEGKARMLTLDKVARRALWWFRYASLATLGTGLLMTGIIENYWTRSGDAHKYTISLGMTIGTLMAANVWMVIWKNQKVVLANAVNVLGGAAADPTAAVAGRKALLGSRQNFIFSTSMLWFMVGPAHYYNQAFGDATSSNALTLLIIGLVIVAILQINALGLLGGTAATNKLLWPYESHKNAMISSGALWLILMIASEVLLK